jgi:hypothetical protein
MRSVLALLVLLPFATATAVRAQPDSHADHTAGLVGAWTCTERTTATPARIVFTKRPSGLTMAYEYADETGTPRELDAALLYDASVGTWTLDVPTMSGLPQFHGSAGSWSAQTWVFKGAVYPPNPGDSIFDELEPAQITFIAFGTNSFELLRSQEVGGQWVMHDPWESPVLDAWCDRRAS